MALWYERFVPALLVAVVTLDYIRTLLLIVLREMQFEVQTKVVHRAVSSAARLLRLVTRTRLYFLLSQ